MPHPFAWKYGTTGRYTSAPPASWLSLAGMASVWRKVDRWLYLHEYKSGLELSLTCQIQPYTVYRIPYTLNI